MDDLLDGETMAAYGNICAYKKLHFKKLKIHISHMHAITGCVSFSSSKKTKKSVHGKFLNLHSICLCCHNKLKIT